jgi:hypothetical protein
MAGNSTDATDRTGFYQAEIIDKLNVYCAHIIREVVRISRTPSHLQPEGQGNTLLCIFCTHLPLLNSSIVHPVGKGKFHPRTGQEGPEGE